MVGHSADVTIGYTAKVKGAGDVEDLAASMSDVDKGKRNAGKVDINARVRGGQDVESLSEDLADMPARTAVDVAAKVTGADKVDDLAADVDGLPQSASSKLTATVAGAEKVHELAADVDGLPPTASSKLTATVAGADKVAGLAGDVDALPSSASTRIEASVSGDDKVDTLAADIERLPATTSVKVSAKVSDGASVAHLNDDLDDVKKHAGDAGESVGGFASEVTGTLGSQFSGNIGVVADFGEQFRNLKGAFSEAGGGITAFGKIAGGIGATIGAGFLIDAIQGDIEEANELMAESKGVVDDLTTSLIDNGNQWDITTQKQLISSIQGTQTFKDLTAAGASASDVLDAFYKGDPAAFGKVWQAVSEGPKAFDATTISALKAGKAMIDSGGQAQDAAKLILDYEEANGLTEDQAGDTASAVDKTGDSFRDTGKDADYATERTKAFDRTKVRDKKSTLTADDKASPKVDAANRKDLKDKKNKLDSDDKASPKVDAANKKRLDDKDSTLDATDYATGRVNAFNSKPISDKTATVDADTDPAQADIDNLNGQTVKVKVDFDINSLNTDYRVSRVGTGSAPSGRASGRAVDALASENASGLMDAAAPAFSPRLTATVSAGVVINFNNVVGDYAATARAVGQVMTRAQRRTGPIQVGGRYGPGRAPV